MIQTNDVKEIELNLIERMKSHATCINGEKERENVLYFLKHYESIVRHEFAVREGGKSYAVNNKSHPSNNEIKKKIEEIIKPRLKALMDSKETYELSKNSLVNEAYDIIIEEMNPLLTEMVEEELNTFRSFCENEVPEKRLSNDHYVLVSLLIDAFLTQRKETLPVEDKR